jgi:hypothetical protein
MPAKKRKATATPSSASAKKVRIGDTTDIPDASAGRPKRSSVGEPNYKVTRNRSSSAQNTPTKADTPAKKKPGRGRPRKVDAEPEPELEMKQPVRRGPGRPPKAAAATTAVEKEATPVKKGRGRPPQGENLPAENFRSTKRSPRQNLASRAYEAISNAYTARAKAAAKASKIPAVPPPAKRGRPPMTQFKPKPKPKAATKPGRPSKVNTTEQPENEAEQQNEDTWDKETDQEAVNGRYDLTGVDETVQYWVMKAEPVTRLENGVDISFSIDDLAAKTEPEPWDGELHAS